MTRLNVVGLVGLLGLVGCASGQEPEGRAAPPAPLVTAGYGDVLIERYADNQGTHHRMDASADAVWRAVREGYSELDIPIGTIDARARRIGNAGFSVRRNLAGEPLSRFFDCGARVVGGTLANTHRLEVSVMTVVAAEGDGHSRIRTQLHAVAYPVGTSTRPTDCVSRGALEDRLAEAVARRLVQEDG